MRRSAKSCPYGVCNPGNDAFPKELFTAQVVLTCTPFDPNNHTEKMDAAFLENQEKYAPFEIAAEFDMGNGYTITAYRRIKAPTVAELDTYRSYLAEEDARFPFAISAPCGTSWPPNSQITAESPCNRAACWL